MLRSKLLVRTASKLPGNGRNSSKCPGTSLGKGRPRYYANPPTVRKANPRKTWIQLVFISRTPITQVSGSTELSKVFLGSEGIKMIDPSHFKEPWQSHGSHLNGQHVGNPIRNWRLDSAIAHPKKGQTLHVSTRLCKDMAEVWWSTAE